MRSISILVSAVALVALVAGCPAQNTPQPMPPPEVPKETYQPPAPGPSPTPTPSPGPTPTPAPSKDDDLVLGADGDPCETAADCESSVCEGQGCGARQGVCAPARRACTKDAVSYCSCDGKSFIASGRCAGQRYQYKGECRSQLADGAKCAAGAECASGVCEGQGCGAEPTGTCAPAKRRCTKDRRSYCGCDGKTFFGSGSCPGARYSAEGACQP
jgi:hypothetical protein